MAENKEKVRRVYIAYAIVGVILAIALYWKQQRGDEIESKLMKSGVTAFAVIYDRCDSRTCSYYVYKFLVLDKWHDGHAPLTIKAGIGDTIQIVFLPEDPDVSRFGYKFMPESEKHYPIIRYKK